MGIPVAKMDLKKGRYWRVICWGWDESQVERRRLWPAWATTGLHRTVAPKSAGQSPGKERAGALLLLLWSPKTGESEYCDLLIFSGTENKVGLRDRIEDQEWLRRVLLANIDFLGWCGGDVIHPALRWWRIWWSATVTSDAHWEQTTIKWTKHG